MPTTDAILLAELRALGRAPDLFPAEADGLAALRGTGHLATPEVLAVTGRLLLLEALVARDDSERSWEGFARDLAVVHRSTPATGSAGPVDRRALERLCARLTEVVPAMPAVLTHGDLWAANLLSQPGGRITVIDPAVSVGAPRVMGAAPGESVSPGAAL